RWRAVAERFFGDFLKIGFVQISSSTWGSCGDIKTPRRVDSLLAAGCVRKVERGSVVSHDQGTRQGTKVGEASMRSAVRIAAAAIAIGVCTSALAGDWEECSLSTPDFRVSACSRLIKETTEPKKLALAHIYRANGFVSRGDKDRATKDFAEAAA